MTNASLICWLRPTSGALLLHLTLSWGNWADNFLHVTTGVVYPATWRAGKVKVLLSMAWQGAGLREMRGWTRTRKRITASFIKFVSKKRRVLFGFQCIANCNVHNKKWNYRTFRGRWLSPLLTSTSDNDCFYPGFPSADKGPKHSIPIQSVGLFSALTRERKRSKGKKVFENTKP